MISVQQTDTTDTTHAGDAHTFTSGHGGDYCERMITHRDNRGTYRLPCNELRDHPSHDVAPAQSTADADSHADAREYDEHDDEGDEDLRETVVRELALWKAVCVGLIIYLLGVATGTLLGV